MNQFALLPDAGRHLCRAIYFRFFVTAALSAVAISALPLLDAFPFDVGLNDWSSYFYIELPIVVMFCLELRKATNTASSYKLIVSDELITREVRKSATLSIPVDQIRHITKFADGSYVIAGNDLLKPIVVPVGIERAEELESLLTRLTPAIMRSQNLHWPKLLAVFVAFLATMMGALFVGNKYMATGLGILFICAMFYCWRVIQQGKDYDKKVRLISHIVLIPAIVVVVRIVWHWAA